jgi:zinc protease
MRNFLLTTVFQIIVISVGYGQTKLIEKINKSDKDIIIPYEKYELSNGLTLILHEDHSDPLIHIDVTYHVGSAREEIKKSGFAHFFEHMMFQGSDNVADDAHFKIVTESGGTLNGSTNRDRTNYYQTVPSNQLESMLWLEADRMGFFLDAVTQEKFEIQRATVKNEKGQNYLNRPYGLWNEKTIAALYPYGHPYSWSTIGYLEDLDRASLSDLKNFFLRWYGPNNASITIGGDINPQEVLAMVEKYFGPIPAGPKVENMKLATAQIKSDRYISHIDNNIRFPAIMMTYPTVPRMHPDEAALDCLADILGIGQSSFLFKKFVETEKAIQASASHPAAEHAGEFSLIVLPYPGQTLAEFEVEIRNTLDEFEAVGVNEIDLIKFKAGRESDVINGLASVSGKVSQLANYQFMFGKPNLIHQDLQRYLDVTAEDVMRVFNKYIKEKSGVIMSYLPSEEVLPAKADNFFNGLDTINSFEEIDYGNLTYQKAKDLFDRSIQPTAGPRPILKVPEYWEASFENGLKIIGTANNEIPTTSLLLTLNGGHRLDAYDPSKSGLASLTAGMLNESTEKYSSEDIQEELRKLGSSIYVSSADDGTYISIHTLNKNIDETLQLAEEILLHPAFKQKDFDRIYKQQLESIKAGQEDPSSIADDIYYQLIYGENHIYSISSNGSEETIANIKLDDVINFYNNYYSPNLSDLVIVGALNNQNLIDLVDKLGFLHDWENKNVEIPKLPKTSTPEKLKIYFVDKPEAPQSEIRAGYVTDLTYTPTGDYFKSYLMNYTLGGAFNSRINLNLREDKGWTYGARSYFSASDEPGSFSVYSGVLAAATDSAIYEIIQEIEGYREKGITDDELQFMKNSIGQREVLDYETPWQKSSFLRRIIHYDLDKSFIDDQSKLIARITKEELNALAKKYLNLNQFYIVIVGDGVGNLKRLKKLGYELIELDAEGKQK